MHLNDIKIGMRVDIPAAVIDKQKMLDFARLYDPIPLHLDEKYAKTTKFGALIAPVSCPLWLFGRNTSRSIFSARS